jgi:hypothetical protein
MYEKLVPAPDPGTWPGRAGWNGMAAESQAATVTQIMSLLGDTRCLVLASGALLTADIAGGAIVMSALLGSKEVAALSALGLLLLVMLSWLRASALVVLAEWPVAVAFSELRRATGAPVDPSAPWLPTGARPMVASDLGWDQVVPLIAAANLRHARARLALSWAVITTIGLCVWMAISFAIAALA